MPRLRQHTSDSIASVASTGGRKLLSQEQLQVRAVYAALEQRGFEQLQELAFRPLGFVSPELRRQVWLALLGLSSEEARDGHWRRYVEGDEDIDDGQTARTMHADVQRSVYSWDVHSCIRRTKRNYKRSQLSEIMHAILNKHPRKLRYFQGFHDITLVFLEVGTAAQAFHMVERLALFHLSDQLCWPFTEGLMCVLAVLFSLLELLDPEVAQALKEAECMELHFAVPWVLTWFAHSLPRLQQVMRLFDCLIAGHPTMVLYFAAALTLQQRETILAADRELPDMVIIFQTLSWDRIDVDTWASHAWQLFRRLPPEELLARVPSQQVHALPPTSPMLHWPHPWLQGGALLDSKAVSEMQVAQLAPIYSCPEKRRNGLSSHSNRAGGMVALRKVGISLDKGTLFRLLGASGVFAAIALSVTTGLRGA
eukprot:TRINITY_DN91417_c0_g1_i1.p1 TRINITY_DN91417_c0_g1~~TRINITY_DN91417_c0_g1_i1.p1  ORF type:complete len:424 (-),score=68.98 TRINITY_DN91417_c0_g1_i1:144-1415(-)